MSRMLLLENISLKFDSELIIDKFNLDISEGEHICLWGPSGSGKTSVLKLIMGMASPSDGHIYFNDKMVDENNISDLRANIAWIPQNINLPVRTALEVLKLLNITDDKSDIFEEKLKTYGLDKSYIYRDFAEMSIGQKQRIIIAATLMTERKILLMDEPTASLDSETIDLIIKDIMKDNFYTVISASHDEQWCAAHDKKVILTHG